MGYLEQKGEITLFGVNMVFLFTALLLITMGYYVQAINVYTGLVITEVALIMLPPMIYVLWKKEDVKSIFRFNRINPRLMGLCALITVCAYPVGLFLNLLGHLILSIFGELMPVPVPVAETMGEYLLGLWVIALIPGIAEEFFFRGLILKGYEEFGSKKAVLISALLFGMFHFNVQNFIGPFFLGLIFGYMVIRTNSIYPAIASHFINNALSVTMAFLAWILADQYSQTAEASLEFSALVSGTLFWGTTALASGFIMMKLLRRLRDVTGEPGTQPREGRSSDVKVYIPLVLTIIMFVIMAVVQMLYIVRGGS